MTCPFLRETRVRTCSAAPLRKMIADLGPSGSSGRCGDTRHAECPVFLEKGGETQGACPHLEEKLVQFCGASPVAHYVPYSPSEASRCGSEAFRYCEAYLSLARPHTGDEIEVHDNLYYAPNHMWVDAGSSGVCHIGLDGLLARLLGRLESVNFLTPGGTRRPGVLVTVCGVDWPLVFPNPLLIEHTNAHLRADASRITRDPYGAGWLFSGYPPPGGDAAGVTSRLMHGRQARAWMEQESQRLSDWIQRLLASRMEQPALACDGGWIVEGAAHLLRRGELLDVLHEFFAPHNGWTKES